MTNEQKQCLLKYLGYYTGKIDGVFGRKSEDATRRFQNDFGGIGVDGIFGSETEKAAKHAVAYGMPEPEETETTTGGSWWEEIEYFDREEFRCTCEGRYCDGFPVEPSEKMVRILDQTRKHFKAPAHVNSGCRCKKRNAEIPGSAANSQHLFGKAADFWVEGHEPKEVAAYIETLIPDTGGIGIYSGFVHVDDRKAKARWTN